jgi:hypothetical protein
VIGHGDDIMEISRGYYESLHQNLSEARSAKHDLEEAIAELGLGHQINAKIAEMREQRAAWRAEDEKRRQSA